MSENSVKLMAALLAAAAAEPGFLYVAADDPAVLELVAAGHAEVNPTGVNPKNKKELATRLTAAGTEAAKAAAAPAAKPTFAVIDFELPKIERKGGGKGGKRKSKYPTDDLGPGQAFFIPVGPEVKSASKTYGSIASGANKKWGDLAAGADFRYFVTRSLDDGKPFGEQYAGKPGIVIGRLKADEATKKRDELIAKAAKASATK